MPPANLITMEFSIAPRLPARRWRLPFGTSLLLHGIGAGLVGWACSHWCPSEFIAPIEFDTHISAVEEPGIDVGWLDVDVPMPAPRPAAAAPSVAAAPVVESAPTTAQAAPTASPVWVPGGAAKSDVPGSDAPGSGTPSGSSETTAFFQVPAQGRSIVYVIDRSSSMGDRGRLALARREVLASLARLTPPARFQIIGYNRFVDSLRVAGRVELLSATEENKELAARFLESLIAEGGTSHQPALDQALALHPDVIYFLTDADDLDPGQVRALTQLNRGRSAINAIELSTSNRDRAEMPMHILARTNGGQYRAVEPSR